MANSPVQHWIVGSAFKDRNEDQTDRFLSEGVWEIDSPSEEDRSTVQTMRPDDRIAIKSTFVQKHGLPFNNHGQSVSVMRIKARGIITENPGNGERVSVAWDQDYEGGDWYFFTYRGVIWQLAQGNEAADQLIEFVFAGKAQDYDWFLAQPFWRDKYHEAHEKAGPSVWIEKTLVTGRSVVSHGVV